METNIRTGHLYAVNHGSHPGIDTPEPFICLNVAGQPRFLFCPSLADSHDGPHDTSKWDALGHWAWSLKPEEILGPWSRYRPPTHTADTVTTTITAATHTSRVTTTTHPNDGYTTWVETTTNNPYYARTLMRWLGATRAEAARHSGVEGLD